MAQSAADCVPQYNGVDIIMTHRFTPLLVTAIALGGTHRVLYVEPLFFFLSLVLIGARLAALCRIRGSRYYYDGLATFLHGTGDARDPPG